MIDSGFESSKSEALVSNNKERKKGKRRRLQSLGSQGQTLTLFVRLLFVTSFSLVNFFVDVTVTAPAQTEFGLLLEN